MCVYIFEIQAFRESSLHFNLLLVHVMNKKSVVELSSRSLYFCLQFQLSASEWPHQRGPNVTHPGTTAGSQLSTPCVTFCDSVTL